LNKQATHRVGVLLDVRLTFKEQHNRCMKQARTSEARLRILPKPHGVVPETVRAVHVG
jgi:hypothetical protein